MSTTEGVAHRRGAAVVQGVLDTALALLTERGYDFTVEEVAARAGVHKTTVYRRWETKAQLVAAAVQQLAEREVPVAAGRVGGGADATAEDLAADPAAAPAVDPADDPTVASAARLVAADDPTDPTVASAEDLAADRPADPAEDPPSDLAALELLAVQVARALRHPAGANALRAAFASAGAEPELRAVAAGFLASRYAAAARLLRRAKDHGLVRDDVDPVLVWRAVVNPLHVGAVLGEALGDDDARALVAIVLEGVRVRPADAG